jgi:hypothetical protein
MTAEAGQLQLNAVEPIILAPHLESIARVPEPGRAVRRGDHGRHRTRSLDSSWRRVLDTLAELLRDLG